MSSSMKKEIETLVSSLKEENFSVKQSGTPHSSVPFFENVDEWWSFTKNTGPKRRDVCGGFLLLRDGGFVSYDFFKGGSKYGEHLKSVPDDLYEDGWTSRDLDVEGIVKFLKTPN